MWATNSCGGTTTLEDNLNGTDEAVTFSDYLILIYQHMPHTDILTKFGQKVTLTALAHIDAQDKIFLSGDAEIVRIILIHKTMLIILQTIIVLPVTFTYFIICLRNKKIIAVILKKD